MGSYISYLFVDPTDLHNNPGGFVQLLFLMACYAFFLYQGSQLISNGSELLLLVPAVAGVVGSVVLPVLGAVPDGAIVLFSGMGPDAQEQLSVGVGALAGSTVMLLTLPWAMCIFAGRVDLDPVTGLPVYKKPANAPAGWTKLSTGKGWRHALFGSGIPIERPMRVNAAIVALTSIAYLLIQLPAFSVGCGKGKDCTKGPQEKWWAFGGFLFAVVAFIAYLVYQMRVGGEEKHYQDKLTNIVAEKVSAGHIGVGAAFFAFIKEDPAATEEEKNVAYLRTPSAARRPLLANESPAASQLNLYDGLATPAAAADGSVAVPINKSASTLALLAASDPHPILAHLRTEKRMHQMLKRFFSKYDRDRSGYIDLAELTTLLRDIGQKMSSEAVKALFASMDSSADGLVDFAEFKEAMMLILSHPSLAQQLEASAKKIRQDKSVALQEQQRSVPQTPEVRGARRIAGVNALIRGATVGNLHANGGSIPPLHARSSSTSMMDSFVTSPGSSSTAAPGTPGASYGSSVHAASVGAVGERASSPVPSAPEQPVRNYPSQLSLRTINGSGAANGADHSDTEDEDAEDDVEEEEEEVPEDLQHLSPAEQQRALIFRSGWMMAAGTALILLFSDPMCDCLSELGARTTIPVFYVSFLLAPLAANASELLAAVNYAAKKTPASITISLTSLEGAASMNNTFCLMIFLVLVFAKSLVWEFSAETLAILTVEIAFTLMCAFKRVHRGIDAIILLSLYPLSMGMVALLENVAGLN